MCAAISSCVLCIRSIWAWMASTFAFDAVGEGELAPRAAAAAAVVEVVVVVVVVLVVVLLLMVVLRAGMDTEREEGTQVEEGLVVKNMDL